MKGEDMSARSQPVSATPVGATEGMEPSAAVRPHYVVEYHPGYEKDGDGEWTVWDENDDWPEPAFVGLSRGECLDWIERRRK